MHSESQEPEFPYRIHTNSSVNVQVGVRAVKPTPEPIRNLTGYAGPVSTKKGLQQKRVARHARRSYRIVRYRNGRHWTLSNRTFETAQLLHLVKEN